MTQALELDARRSSAPSSTAERSSGMLGPPECQPLGPVYAGIAVGALAVAGATAVGLRWASRPPAPRTITMGPGGWISFKGFKPPPVTGRRPWWAVLVRARQHT